MVKKKVHVTFILFLALIVSIAASVEAENNSYAKAFNPVQKSLGTVSKSNRNRCIAVKGIYTLTVAGQGKVTSTVYNIAYIPNKYINTEIKNLKASKINEDISVLGELVPHIGAVFKVSCYYKNKQIDSMISNLKKIKKSGKGAQITFYKVSGVPYSYTTSSWDGKTIMKKSYKYTKNKSTHRMVVKKSDIKYGKK